jgi:hypothetical protein
MKIKPSYYNGLEFISLSNLPYLQFKQINEWIPITSLMKVVKDGFEYCDCIIYDEYEYWFENFFKQAPSINFDI